MGKGRIVSHIGDGLYTVELLHNRDRIEAELQALGEQLAQIEEEIAKLETEREPLVADRNWIATQIDQAVANVEEGEIPDVEALLVELAQVSAQIQQLDVRIAMTKGRRLEANKRKQMLESVPADPQPQAWCADYTEDLTGEVATIEVPAEGEVGQFLTWRRVQIRPGHAGGAVYNPARDGQMFHREGQAGYQAYLNAAILPGVQRWKPQYRIGVLTAIDKGADTCSLTIQGEDSSAQALIIDPPDLVYNKTDVPIVYMTCNAQPFEVGDRVLVEFQGRDWQQPRVIGFETEPRECELVLGFQVALIKIVDPRIFITVDHETYPPPPDGYVRDRGIQRVRVGYYDGWSTVSVWNKDLDAVEAATVYTELPEADDTIETAEVTFNEKCAFDCATGPGSERLSGLFVLPSGDGTPALVPIPASTVSETSVTYTVQEYAAGTRGIYRNVGFPSASVLWSNDIDTGNLLGSCEATFNLADFPETVTVGGKTWYRWKISGFVPMDYDANIPPADLKNPRILVRYAASPPE